MPSLNAKRQVRYTQADLRAVEGTVTLLDFMSEFDDKATKEAEEARSSLGLLLAHIKRECAPKPADAPQQKPKIANAG